MYPLSKSIRVAVIGTPSSGKSYLLYDLIYAFSLLEYKAMELPLNYPHSSFGAYFHDVFNVQTGGMRGTEAYICRPENHYGAYLASKKPLRLPFELKVDFLNIPGEAFMTECPNGGENEVMTITLFFMLKSAIEQCPKGFFCLSQWKSPAGHIRNLVIPKGFILKARKGFVRSSGYRYVNFLSFDDLRNELGAGKYEHVKDKKISGQYILNHLPELDIDSVMASIESKWNNMPGLSDKKMDDFKAKKVIKYFYPLCYCQNATDVIICDRLTSDSQGGVLSQAVRNFMMRRDSRRPHTYLAFREADVLLKEIGSGSMKRNCIFSRNEFYANFLSRILSFDNNGKAILKPMDRKDIEQRIKNSLGNGENHFGLLLRSSYKKNEQLEKLLQSGGDILPPHVYFTATPIDADGTIYYNDSEDITRFIYESGTTRKAFVREVCEDMSRHACFGSLQLLIDILLQNGIRSDSNDYMIKYFQGIAIR